MSLGPVHGVAGGAQVRHVAVLVHPEAGPTVLVKQPPPVEVLGLLHALVDRDPLEDLHGGVVDRDPLLLPVPDL